MQKNVISFKLLIKLNCVHRKVNQPPHKLFHCKCVWCSQDSSRLCMWVNQSKSRLNAQRLKFQRSALIKRVLWKSLATFAWCFNSNPLALVYLLTISQTNIYWSWMITEIIIILRLLTKLCTNIRLTLYVDTKMEKVFEQCDCRWLVQEDMTFCVR